MRKKLKVSATLFLLFPLTACATNTQGISDGSCKIFKPISNSKLDTERTRREVIAHNRVYTSICK